MGRSGKIKEKKKKPKGRVGRPPLPKPIGYTNRNKTEATVMKDSSHAKISSRYTSPYQNRGSGRIGGKYANLSGIKKSGKREPRLITPISKLSKILNAGRNEKRSWGERKTDELSRAIWGNPFAKK